MRFHPPWVSTSVLPTRKNRSFGSRLLSPEILALLVAPTAILALLVVFGMYGRTRFDADFWFSLRYLRFFGWQFFYVICAAAVAYLSFSAAAYAIRSHRKKRAKYARRRFPQRLRLHGPCRHVRLCVRRQLYCARHGYASRIGNGSSGPTNF